MGASTNSTTVRPLIMRCGAFGDMVLLSTLIQELSHRCSAPVDIVTSGAWSRPLLAVQANVGEVHVIRSRRAPFALSPDQWALVRWLRSRPVGPVWFADPNGTGLELLRRGGIADDCLCDYRELQEPPQEHVTARWQRFAALTPPRFAGRLPVAPPLDSHNAVLQIEALLPGLRPWLERRGLEGRRFVAIQAGNKRTMGPGWAKRATNTKYWPVEHWGEVLRAIRATDSEAAILLLGVDAERGINRLIERAAGLADVHNVAGDLPVEILLPLLQAANSLVSVDTGPAHAAAALGCPSVVLFGKANPWHYRPGGQTTPVTVLTGTVDGVPNILGIQPQAVIEAWRARHVAHSGERHTSVTNPF